jgi:hypothetical protein
MASGISKTVIENHGNINFVRIDSLNNPESRLLMAKRLLKGYKWYLSFGTALGFYRDGDFIPNDSDIDISIIADDIDTDKIIKDFSDRFFYLRSVTREGQQHQSAFQDTDGFILDLQFYYKSGKKHISYCQGGKWEDDDKIEMIETKYGEMPFPAPIEEYLLRRYGKNWKIPSSDKSIKQ